MAEIKCLSTCKVRGPDIQKNCEVIFTWFKGFYNHKFKLVSMIKTARHSLTNYTLGAGGIWFSVTSLI